MSDRNKIYLVMPEIEDLIDGNPVAGIKVVCHKIVGHGKWSNSAIHEIVVEHRERFYKYLYDSSPTESGEQKSTEVFIEVFPVEKKVTVYE